MKLKFAFILLSTVIMANYGLKARENVVTDNVDKLVVPMDARILGSFVSDNFPENDATRAIITGCAINTKPASFGDSPLTYCKYKLKTNVIAKVAA